MPHALLCAPHTCARLQAEMHVHDAYDFSDDEGVPPFREQLSLAAKRSHGGGKQAAGKRGRAH